MIDAFINLIEGNGSTDQVEKAFQALYDSIEPLFSHYALRNQLYSLLVTLSDQIVSIAYTFATGNPLLQFLLDYISGPSGTYR